MNDELLKQAKKLQSQIAESLNIHNKMLDDLGKTIEDKGHHKLINDLKSDINNTLKLAKSGDLQAINEIINRYASQTNK
jgi:hypothetical protein